MSDEEARTYSPTIILVDEHNSIISTSHAVEPHTLIS